MAKASAGFALFPLVMVMCFCCGDCDFVTKILFIFFLFSFFLRYFIPVSDAF